MKAYLKILIFASQTASSIDDLLEESKASTAVTALYTKATHHRPYFIINILQNLYFQSKEQRSRHLNTQYMVIFYIPRDVNQIAVLSHQMLINSYMEKLSP